MSTPRDPSASTVAVFGLPTAARERLAADGRFRLVEGADEAAAADVALVSTRLGRMQLTGLLSTLRAHAGCPIVGLAHTGGEALAVEVMRAGGTSVVAEGNELALSALLRDDAHDTSLVDTYERQVGHGRGRSHPSRDRDGVTGLPGRATFEQRIGELASDGHAATVALLRVRNLDQARLASETVDLVRRRLASQFGQLLSGPECELFALAPVEFALLAPQLPADRAQQLGLALARVTETFAPSGNTRLELAVGLAGPDSGSELPVRRELALRALEVAAGEHGSAVVSADSLALGLASSTELEAAMRMLAVVERHDSYPAGHGRRVADHAAELALRLGVEGAARIRIELAAYLHDIGKVGLPVDALRGPAVGGQPEAGYRSHPARGADYLRLSAGKDVAAAVRGHHERWDGAGFPDGLAGEDIPLGARIVAVANRLDGLTAAGVGGGEPRETLALLRDDAGGLLDPALVELAVPLLQPRLRPGS